MMLDADTFKRHKFAVSRAAMPGEKVTVNPAAWAVMSDAQREELRELAGKGGAAIANGVHANGNQS